jgi:superfamily II DNA or RNA helicase
MSGPLMYKNKNMKMPLHVPETLFEHYLYETIQDAEDIFADASICINDPIRKEFFDLFSDAPEYIGKFAEWSMDEDNDLDDIQDLYKDILELKNLRIKLDKDINSFPDMNSFSGYLTKLKNKKSRELPPAVKETPAKLNTNIENAEDRDEEDIPDAKTIDEKMRIKPIKSGFQCALEIFNSDALTIPGQGLYVWTNKEYLNRKKNIPLKFGQYGSQAKKTQKTPITTIESYTHTTADDIVILYAIRLDDYLKSSQNVKGFKNAYEIEQIVGKKIVEQGGYHEDRGKSTELFGGFTLKSLIELINEILYDTTDKLKNFSMRPEQKDAHDKMIENYQSGSREFLLAAKMRFGKNFTLLNVAKDLGFKNILVLTYKPHVFPSLKDDIKNHVNFKDWDIIDFKEDRDIKESKKIPTVFMSSAQLAQYKKAKAEDDEDLNLEQTSIEEISKNLEKLKKIHWDIIIADEYHYGTSTKNFKNIIEELKINSKPYIVYVSGTAMKDIEMGRFNNNQIFEWSYLEEQQQKKLELKGDIESKQHIDMPTMQMHLIEIDPDVVSEIESHYDIEAGEGFTMKKLISTNKDKSLKYPGALEKFLEQIAGKNTNIDMSPYQFVGGLNHTLWVLPKWTAGILSMAKLMEKMDSFGGEGYKILPATGNVIKDIEDIKEAINKYPKTITLTCYRFKEGVSVPKWNGVFMMDDGRSVEEYLQAIFRVQNPDPENDKDECYVFDFNPQRGLSMTYEICENSNKSKSTDVEKTFNEFRKYAPIFYHKNNNFEEVDFKQIMDAFKSETNWREKFANIKNLDLEKIDEKIIKSISGVSPGKRGKTIEINDNQIELGKNLIPKNKIGRGDKKMDKDKIRETLEKIATVLSNIPEFLFNTKDKEKSLKDLLATNEKELFLKITGITLDDFRYWVDSELINPVLMTRNISSFFQAESELMSDFSGNKLEDFSKKNFQLKAEEGKTPLPLVREMLDKLPSDIWRDSSKTFCDLCMGMGTFLIEIKDRLMTGLEEEFPDKNERETYILENMLYGSDTDESKYNMALKLLGTNRDKEHIINKDSLTYNWNMKFDVVVGNPPYKGRTHLEFLNLAWHISERYIVWVHPGGWLFNKLGKTKIYEDIKDLINGYVEEINMFSFRKYFPIRFHAPGLVLFIDKRKKTDQIKAIDEFKDQRTTYYNDIRDINIWNENKLVPDIENKIISKASINNFSNHIDKEEGPFYIKREIIAGGANETQDNRFDLDFFYLTVKNPEVFSSGKKPKYWFSFRTKEEAENALKFLRSPIGRFIVSLRKIDQNVGTYHWSIIPWLNWDQEWDNEKFCDFFNLTKREIQFIEESMKNFDWFK